jgi:hypothetical protein
LITIVGAVIVAGAVFAGVVLAQNSNPSASGTPVIPTPLPGKVIAGLHCDASEQLNYHQHAHIEFLIAGQPVALPAFVGYNYNHACLYWVHTHNTSGVIHIESPSPTTPTLGDFFDVWHQPLSRNGFWTYSVKPGQSMKVFVNKKLYVGNPRDIGLHRHTLITIEIGPPFKPPAGYAFGNL